MKNTDTTPLIAKHGGVVARTEATLPNPPIEGDLTGTQP